MFVKGLLNKLAERMADYGSCSRAELNAYDQRFHKEFARAFGNPVFIKVHERTQYEFLTLRLPILFMGERIALATS